MKRILSIALIAVLLLGLVPMIPQAQAAKGGKLVALTFDDGPCNDTSRLLDGLAKRGAHVTFFMVGQNAKNYPETIKRAYQEGHQIANHSYDHSNLVNLSNSEIRSQIDRTNGYLDKACGKGTTYLVRPPYGSTNSRVRNAIGVPLVNWSVDPEDWKYRNADKVTKHVLNNVKDGSIVLLHDIHPTSVDAAFRIVDELQARGYEFVTVRELFRRRGEAMENCEIHYSCYNNGTDLGPVEKPTITGKGVNGSMEITITAQKGADIYYSTDGSDLNQESKRYTGPFTVKTPCTVKAVAAFDMNGSRSEVSRKEFTIPVAQKPTANIKSGVLTLTTPSPKATIYYTTDNSMPNEKSKVYSGPVTLKPGTLVRAAAGGKDYLLSEATKVYYSPNGNFFRDVFPDQWYCKEIDRAASAGYMQGTGNNNFNPTGNISRGQLVTLLYRYAKASATQQDRDNCPFTDVKTTSYYYDPIAWAYANGIVDGYKNNVFCPERPITREEMCKFLGAFIHFRGKAVPDGLECLDKYKDREAISDWATSYVASMSAIGLFKGDTYNKFLPHSKASRAQAATVLNRLADLESTLPDLPPEPTPTEPSDPTEPSNPTEPSDPVEPSNPAVPSNPTEPSDPAEPSNPTEP